MKEKTKKSCAQTWKYHNHIVTPLSFDIELELFLIFMIADADREVEPLWEPPATRWMLLMSRICVYTFSMFPPLPFLCLLQSNLVYR